MCVVSVIYDYGRREWPIPSPFPIGPSYPEPQTEPKRMTLVEYIEYQELVRKAKEFDRISGQPDCEDKVKEKWFNELKEYMRKTYGLEPKE